MEIDAVVTMSRVVMTFAGIVTIVAGNGSFSPTFCGFGFSLGNYCTLAILGGGDVPVGVTYTCQVATGSAAQTFNFAGVGMAAWNAQSLNYSVGTDISTITGVALVVKLATPIVGDSLSITPGSLLGTIGVPGLAECTSIPECGSFIEARFPTELSFRAMGGPGFSTEVKEGFSGCEQRNRNWAKSRSKWTVGLQTPAEFAGNRQEFADALEAFFLAIAIGKGNGFRFKDHKDYKATAQVLAPVPGSTTQYQLAKTYTVGGRSYVRPVKKPVTPAAVDYQGNALASTVKIYLNGILQSSGYTVDATTGIVTFSSAPSAAVTADFEFDHPVRLDVDEFAADIQEGALSQGPLLGWSSVQLVEVRL
jgi:uncharacterized protein (TIGR02217 family)